MNHAPGRVIRVAVVGDAGVGKTSLISTAATDTFDPRPPPHLPPTRLPPDFSGERTPMLLTDTSSRPEDFAATDRVIQQAHVVVICFEARRPATLDSVRTIWYPRVLQLNSEAPVILACCKSDRVAEDAHDELQQLRERVERCVYDLPGVEVCLNCSAQTLRMVTDIFGYALKSVLYPMQPLFDRVERRMRPLAIKALKRVFIICDTDKDSHLDNAELNEFQQACFGLSLTDEELNSIKTVVKSQNTYAVNERGLTLDGFLLLHQLFIERGRLESTWTVLKNYGYSYELHIDDDVLDTVNFYLPADAVYELSARATQFLVDTFCWYDSDGDNHITHEQLVGMFSAAPQPLWQGERWSRLLTSGTLGSILSLDAFLLKWRYAVLSDPRGALAAILYLGWGAPTGSPAAPPSALLTRCTRRRRTDKRHDPTMRTSLHCYVFGSRGCGKTALLKALAGRQPQEQLTGWAGGGATTAVGLVQVDMGSYSGSAASGGNGTPGGTHGGNGGSSSVAGGLALPPTAVSEHTLVLSEVSDEVSSEWLAAASLAASGDTPAVVTPGQGKRYRLPMGGSVPGPGVVGLPDLARCDVAAFMFDSSQDESFRRALEMMQAVSTASGSTLPCVLIAAKDDLGIAQRLEVEVAAECATLAIHAPLAIAAEAGDLSGVFRHLAEAALFPAEPGLVPDTPARKAQKVLMRQLHRAGAGVAFVAVAAGVCWWLYSGPPAGPPAEAPPPPEAPVAAAARLPTALPSAAPSASAAELPSYAVSPPSSSGALPGGGGGGLGSGPRVPDAFAWGGGGGRGWYSSPSEPVRSWWEAADSFKQAWSAFVGSAGAAVSASSSGRGGGVGHSGLGKA